MIFRRGPDRVRARRHAWSRLPFLPVCQRTARHDLKPNLRKFRMPYLRVAPDLDMHYLIDDFTDPWRKSTAILLLHGNNESAAAWYGWAPHLARRYRVVRPDMRGFGESTPMPADFPWTLDIVIDDYLRLMD